MPSWSNSGPAITSPSGDTMTLPPRHMTSGWPARSAIPGRSAGYIALVTYWLQPSTKQRPSHAMWRSVACQVSRLSAVGAR